MQKSWSASKDRWQIYIDDPEDPALAEFAFPDLAYGWLRSPETCLQTLDAVRNLSFAFSDRLQRFVARGQVKVACFAEGSWVSADTPPRLVRPGFDHVALLGPDGPKELDGKSGDVQAVALPLVRPAAPAPSWEAFPLVAPEFRAACEQLAGVTLGGLFVELPVIEPWAEWSKWQRQFAFGSQNKPPELLAAGVKLWALQLNYYGVVTLLEEPGRLVLAKGRELRVLEDRSPQDWLAAELEGGTTRQPSEI